MMLTITSEVCSNAKNISDTDDSVGPVQFEVSDYFLHVLRAYNLWAELWQQSRQVKNKFLQSWFRIGKSGGQTLLWTPWTRNVLTFLSSPSLTLACTTCCIAKEMCGGLILCVYNYVHTLCVRVCSVCVLEDEEGVAAVKWRTRLQRHTG